MPYFPGPRSDQLPPHVAAALIGWARVPPAKAWKRPGMPQDWCPLLECDPNEPNRPPLAGWVYLWVDNRIREVDSRALEIVKGSKRTEEILEPVKAVLSTGGYVPFGDHLIPPEVHWREFQHYRTRLNEVIDGRD